MNLLFELDNLPFPPSVNGCYKTVIMKGKPRRVPSKELKEFKEGIEEYRLQNLRLLAKGHKLLFGKKLYAEFIFKIQLRRIIKIQKKNFGEVKRFDVSNRIKNIEDGVFEILNIDDSVNWKVSAEKYGVKMIEEQCVKVRFYEYSG